MTETVPNKSAFVTGASRGIGAETAKALARAGYDVALGYQDPKKEKRVRAVIEEIENLGHEALPIRGDITDKEDLADISAKLTGWSPLHALVLNAAGGLEKNKVDADPQYALRVNRDAQVNVVESQLHRLVEGSSVVFVTSDWAHKYSEVALPPFDYELIASSKHLGELALRAKQKELATMGSRLLVATAGLVTETYVGNYGIKIYPDFAQQQEAMGNIVSAAYVGERIAAAIEDPSLASGHTEWIGADEATFMSHSRLER